MKDRNKNSRIKFINSEIKTIIDSLNHWIEIETQIFRGKSRDNVKLVFDFIQSKTMKVKEEYILNLNFEQLKYIHGAVAEEYIDYKNIEKYIALNICKNIENILRSNYKITTNNIIHPCNNWE